MRILRFFPITCYYSDKTIPFVLTDIRFRIFLKKLWNFFITYVTIISVAQAWRNWQTRTVQVRVGQPVQVQILLSALKFERKAILQHKVQPCL